MDTENLQENAAAKTTSDVNAVSARELAGPLVDGKAEADENISNVEENAGPSTEENSAESQAENDSPDFVQRDKGGVPFDPAIHATDENGNPKLTRTGNFARKRGRKPSDKDDAGTDLAPKNSPKTEDDLLIDAHAENIVQGVYGVSCSLLGEEFMPENEAEHIRLKNSLAAYMKASGHTNPPPELALIAAGAGYFGKRLAKPTVRARIVTIYIKAREWMNSL